ncbi:hypothetical protein N7481_012585 [Penicillium waksmanii]|uniref:uncharacterized protein n=1 Tax=Penicillium waksmanii TaxID=69791 RepID=UPI0025483AA2|nr:uncharacterized protein N7481_012585 [Penicillium waksmanii]KAJ5965871.1 hypothetical protein N7481_012585 [Penicillium waksmanii]
MSSNPPASSGPGARPGPRPPGPAADRKGSVKRAREQLEAGLQFQDQIHLHHGTLLTIRNGLFLPQGSNHARSIRTRTSTPDISVPGALPRKDRRLPLRLLFQLFRQSHCQSRLCLWVTLNHTGPQGLLPQVLRRPVPGGPLSHPFQRNSLIPAKPLVLLPLAVPFPSSWGSGPAESEILGAYLDTESEDEEHSQDTVREDKAALVRNASVGKRGKPTMRTIMKSNPNSEVMVPGVPSTQHKGDSQSDVSDSAVITVAAIGKAMRQPTPVRRASASTVSGESYIDPEKPRFAHPVPDHMDLYRDTSLEKEVEALPSAAPTMSDKRPGGRKPPRLDIGAVRNAEARGSLSSLSDLIRRATKLASNLDHGRTASRNDVLNADAEPKPPFGRRRNSGSISDILHMFPNPALDTPDKPRGSWPVFFGRSGLRNGEALGSNADEPAPPKARTPLLWHGAKMVHYSLCISSNVDNGTISKNATMGSSLPTIFNQSKTKFDITLDPVTIMALFSMNNISCKTENALISFSDVDRSSSSSSSENSRRSIDLDLDLDLDNLEDSTQPTPTLLAARSEQTINGILVDGSGNHSGSKETKTTSIAANPATATATSTGSSKAKSTGVPESVIEFSQVAVLFIMQDTGSLDSALSSEKQIASYLSDSYATASMPSLELMGAFSLDFANKTITREGTGLTVH